jgi:hypothetical protein
LSHGLEQVVHRLMTDRDFRHFEQIQPLAALSDFDLSEEEREAIIKRDQFRLESLGLEPWTARWVAGLR